MPKRPVVLFPTPERVDRDKKFSSYTEFKKPSFHQQYKRLEPKFSELQRAYHQKNMQVQESIVGINPDFVLVFEIVGTVDSFYTAIQHYNGIEWLFDVDIDSIEPDDDFYVKKKGARVEDLLNGRLYCVMSNQKAIEQLLSLWKRHLNGEKDVFKRGFAGLRDVFTHIKTIRRWNAADRIAETGVVEFWRESLELDGDCSTSFEIELFYRKDVDKRNMAVSAVKKEVQEKCGRVLQECVIDEIEYHSLLVEMPRNVIEELVHNYESIHLVHVDDIMFFRPVSQAISHSSIETDPFTGIRISHSPVGKEIIAAVLDGVPLQNHILLKDRIIFDDPDSFEESYEAKYRIHGTSMASLAIYGDLNKGDDPVNHPIYMRPILRPKEVTPHRISEMMPQGVLFVDLVHRAIKRMKEGEQGQFPVAPHVAIVNLSIGDSSRQLSNTISPLARLIDYLSYKYRILFVISAGNHSEIINSVTSSFSDLKKSSFHYRNDAFWSVIKDNQWNLKLISPAESINTLTIGAIYDDYSDTDENDRAIWAVSKGMPSPISAIGKGYHGIITPDLVYNGGRKFIKGSVRNQLAWVTTNSAPGCKVAAPYNDGTESGQAFSFGTSVASAQMTHEAMNCYDVLSQIFYDETEEPIPLGYEAVLVKGMLTHGATWDSFGDELNRVTTSGRKKLSKWVGYGFPDIERVKECTQKRITLIGYGELKKDQADVFRLPLYIDFSSQIVKRKLTVTLAYFSPITANKQAYRTAQLWFEVDDNGSGLVISNGSRTNSEWQAVRKGTLQHETFVANRAIVWNDDDLVIKVNCKEDAGKIRSEKIPYCIFVTFEVGDNLGVDLYTEVKNQIRQRAAVQRPRPSLQIEFP